jgi:hypothetical protein
VNHRGPTLFRWRWMAFAATVVVVFSVVVVASAMADARLVWSAPVLVDRAVPRGAGSLGIQALACPAVSLCVAFDDLGNLVTSTRPGSVGSWRTTRLPGARGLFSSNRPLEGGVSCPSVSFCVALTSSRSGGGRVIVSTAPASGPRAWHIERVGVAVNPNAISCPSESLCVGVEEDGNVLTSSDPAGGAGTWQVAHVDGARSLSGKASLDDVSCPSVSFCVAVDDAGHILTSTNPTGGPSAWQAVHFENLGGGGALSCPSVSFCVAADGGVILTSTNPAGGSSAWTKKGVVAGALTPTISCPSESLCVANNSGPDGRLVTSTSPTGGAATWRQSLVERPNMLNVMSCPSASFCAVADDDGNILVGTPAMHRIAVPTVIPSRKENPTLFAKRHGRILSVDSGLAVACPRGGPACRVTGSGVELNPVAQRFLFRFAGVKLTVPAGRRREVVFVLTRSGAGLLIKEKGLGFDFAALQIVARARPGLAVAAELPEQILPPL